MKVRVFSLFLLLSLLILSSFVFADGNEPKSDVPSENEIVSAYSRHIEDKNLGAPKDKAETQQEKTDREQKIKETLGDLNGEEGYTYWVNKFYTDESYGWNKYKSDILNSVSGANIELIKKLTKLIDEKGRRISFEWALKNEIRKVNSDDFEGYLDNLKEIISADVGSKGLFGFLNKYRNIDEKVVAFITLLNQINLKLDELGVPKVETNIDEDNNNNGEKKQNVRFDLFDIPRIYSFYPSGTGLIGFLEQIFKQTLTVPGFKLDSYKIFTDFFRNDPFTISTNFAQKYPKGALINLQKNNEGNYVPQINNFESLLENNAPTVLIKPITDVTEAKIILRNKEPNKEDITFIANENIWPALVKLAETSDVFQRLNAQSWPVFVRLLEQNMADAGVELIQTPYTIATTGTHLEENSDYVFDAKRDDEDSFTISTRLLNKAIPENSVIIATVVDESGNSVISFKPRVLSAEETYADNRLYETFGSDSFTVDIEIITQQKENSFESLMNSIEQRTLPSRFESMVYSAMS